MTSSRIPGARPVRALRLVAFVLAAIPFAVGRPVAAQDLSSRAASSDSAPPRNAFGVMLGLGQWALGGGNVAVQGNIGRLALEYSHGQGVNLPSYLLSSSEKAAGATARIAWTTGAGVGLLVGHDLRLLVEVKVHHYQLEGGDRNSFLSYTVMSVGPGVFYDVHLGHGMYLQPSIRWWPSVASNIAANASLRRAVGTSVPVQRHDSGLFPNISLGWTF